MSARTCRWSDGKADRKIVPPRLRIPYWKGLGAESEEKHEPASDIDTGVVDSLKALDLKRPIREADISVVIWSASKAPLFPWTARRAGSFRCACPQAHHRARHASGRLSNLAPQVHDKVFPSALIWRGIVERRKPFAWG